MYKLQVHTVYDTIQPGASLHLTGYSQLDHKNHPRSLETWRAVLGGFTPYQYSQQSGDAVGPGRAAAKSPGPFLSRKIREGGSYNAGNLA